MTSLVVQELRTNLVQSFTVTSEKRISLNAIRIYLYMSNAPSGVFTLSLKDASGVLVSKDFTSADIKTDLGTTDNYAYIHKVIQFDELVQLSKQTYTLELTSSGYTFEELAFIAWVREHENIFNTTDGLNDNFKNNPLSFQIYNNRRA